MYNGWQKKLFLDQFYCKYDVVAYGKVEGRSCSLLLTCIAVCMHAFSLHGFNVTILKNRTIFSDLQSFNGKKNHMPSPLTSVSLCAIFLFSFCFPVMFSTIRCKRATQRSFCSLAVSMWYLFIKCFLLSVCTSTRKDLDVHGPLFTDSWFKWNKNKAIPVVNFPILYSYEAKL